MANTKISALTSGNPAQSSDLLPIDRSGVNYSITAGSVAALASDGTVTSFSAGALSPLFTVSVATPTTTPALSFALDNAGQNDVLAGPSSGGTGAPSYRALVVADLPSGYVWSSLGSATAALTLSNTTYGTTFHQTSAVDWLWANTTAATGTTAGSSSPLLQLQGQAYVSSASVNSTYSIQNVISSINASQSTLTVAHTGTDTSLGVSLGTLNLVCGTVTSSGEVIASVAGYFTWSGGAAMFQTSGAISAYTSTSKTTYAPLTVAATTLGLVSYTTALTNSPALTLAGSYESAATPTYAEDSWSITDVIGTGVNGTSTLTFAHSGSTGLASISAPNINVSTAYYAGGTVGVSAGPFSAITSIQTIGGIVTTLADVSDERLKDHSPYAGGLKEVLKLTPIKYTWNAEGQRITGFDENTLFVGFSAQDVLKTIPEAVRSSVSNSEYLGFSDRPIMAALVNAIKELELRLSNLEGKLFN